MKELIDGYIYVIKNENTNFYKIGFTNDYKRRFRSLTTQSGCKLKTTFLGITEVFEDLPINVIEGHLHKKFSNKRIIGEWFDLNQKDLNFIIDYLSHECGYNFLCRKYDLLVLLNYERTN